MNPLKLNLLTLNKRFLHFVIMGFSLSMLTVPTCFAQMESAETGTTINKFPFTNLDFNDDSSKVQFAIVSDLWGGYRPGIFEDAVSKIELLQPQFVMSVGDLIDGATYDSSVIENQWNDFNRMIKPLTMPFFYVAGNHDIGNPLMEKFSFYADYHNS